MTGYGYDDREYVDPHRGAMILTLGILGLVVCFILGIVAWAMGNRDLDEMRAGRMDPSGEGLTQAGRVCGIVSVILPLVVIGIWLFFILVLGGLASMA